MRSSIIKMPAMGLIAASAAFVPMTAQAGAELSAGVWWVYQNVTKSDFTSPSFSEELDNETGGNFADPSLIIYADDDGSYGPWHFSAETRFGTGSFTNTASNNSGDNIVVHKAWIGYDVTDNSSLKIGKSNCLNHFGCVLTGPRTKKNTRHKHTKKHCITQKSF